MQTKTAREDRTIVTVSNQGRTLVIAAFLVITWKSPRPWESSNRWPTQWLLSTCGTTGGMFGREEEPPGQGRPGDAGRAGTDSG